MPPSSKQQPASISDNSDNNDYCPTSAQPRKRHRYDDDTEAWDSQLEAGRENNSGRNGNNCGDDSLNSGQLNLKHCHRNNQKNKKEHNNNYSPASPARPPKHRHTKTTKTKEHNRNPSTSSARPQKKQRCVEVQNSLPETGRTIGNNGEKDDGDGGGGIGSSSSTSGPQQEQRQGRHVGTQNPPLEKADNSFFNQNNNRRLNDEGNNDNDISFNSLSVLQQAAAFCFGTLNLQLDCVDLVWNSRYGTNRPINAKHVNRLMMKFQSGLHRTDPQNHLYIACSVETWSRLERHCQESSTRLTNPENPGDNSPFYSTDCERRNSIKTLFSPSSSISSINSPIIWNWKNCNIYRLELLAGQHRIHALRQLLQQRYSSNTDASNQINQHLWWTCRIYNQGR